MAVASVLKIVLSTAQVSSNFKEALYSRQTSWNHQVQQEPTASDSGDVGNIECQGTSTYKMGQ